ncbi:MAG: redoxin domain-containing protein [Deltaproteobacteria bacterium]|nr:redoxin domain-containing protein [Deltaproteobacteria bacterium]
MNRSIVLLGACAAALLLSTPAEAGKRRLSRDDKAVLSADRELMHAMHLRDRGQLADAFAEVQELLERQPDLVPAHLLYQEMAAVVRRNGGLVEAEYRYYLNMEPEDPKRMVLHAAATLTAALTTPRYLAEESMDGSGVARGARRIKDIERSLAAAEVSEEASSYAHLVYSEVEQVRQRFPQVHERLKKAVEADDLNLSARGDLIVLLVSQKETTLATQQCLELIDLAPWRIGHCKALFPGGPDDERVATPEERATVLERAEQIEKAAKGDPVVLEALREFHANVNDEEMVRIEKLLAADPTWAPPLRRNPYLPPLDGGEWTAEELKAVERLLTIVEANEDLKVQLLALGAHEAELPESARVRAQYWRLMAGALRDAGPEKSDESRAALRKAMDLMPEEPGLMNEWAYMSAIDKVDLAEALEVSNRSLELLLGREFDPIQIEPGSHYGEWSDAVGQSVGAYTDTRGWLLYQLGRYQEAVADLQLAASLTIDGTVQGHLGRARYAMGQDEGAFQHLLRALAMGTEDEEEVRKLASHLYGKSRIVDGGLEALVRETHRQILDELGNKGGRSGGSVPNPEVDVDASPRPGSRDVHGFGSESDHELMGEIAPNLTIKRIGDGGELDLESLRGEIVVLDFWATWCGPCRKALPMFEALSLAFEDEPVTFVMASVDDSMGEIEDFWADLTMPVEVGLVQGKGADAFSVRGIPAMFIIGKDGEVIGHHVGYEEGEGEALAATLAVLVSTSE